MNKQIIFFLLCSFLLLPFYFSTSVFSDTLPTGDSITTSDFLQSLYIETVGSASSGSTSYNTYSTTVNPTFTDGVASFGSTVFSSWGSNGQVFRTQSTTTRWNFYSQSVQSDTRYFELRLKIATVSASNPTWLNYGYFYSNNNRAIITVTNNGNVSTTISDYTWSQSDSYMTFKFSYTGAVKSVQLKLGATGTSFSPYIWNNQLNHFTAEIRQLSFEEFQNEQIIEGIDEVNQSVNDVNQSIINLDTGMTTAAQNMLNKINQNRSDEAAEHDETVGLLESIIDFIEDTLDAILDLPNTLGNMLKSLFIPSDDYFEDFFDDINSLLEEKLGFIYQTFDYITDLFTSVGSSSSENFNFSFTLYYLDNGAITSRVLFNENCDTVFSGGLFAIIQPYIKIFTTIILAFLLLFFGISMFKKITNPTVDIDD